MPRQPLVSRAFAASMILPFVLGLAPRASAHDPLVTLDNGSTGYLVLIEVPAFADEGEIDVIYDFDGERPSDDAAIAAASAELCQRDLKHILGAARRAFDIEVRRIDIRFRWKTFREDGFGWSADVFVAEYAPDCSPHSGR